MKFLKIFIIFFFSNNLFSQSNYGNFVELKRLFIQEKYDLISQMDNNFDKKTFIFKISGLWENKDNIGITFKIILMDKYITF